MAMQIKLIVVVEQEGDLTILNYSLFYPWERDKRKGKFID